VFSLSVSAPLFAAHSAPRYRHQPIVFKKIDSISNVRSAPQKFNRMTSTNIVTRPLLVLLALYKRWISPLLGRRCRFEPSCSDYAQIAIARFGTTRGSLLVVWRLARCQPFARAGSDPVPAQFPSLWRHAPTPSCCTCNSVAAAAHCKAEAHAESPAEFEEKHHD
jgi:putative membrane protein insertion efficiency factor